ncbi:hypothetical protein D9611_002020 [Ephemerocybe angulata]|uniref:Uncharacterized protein n=1 Tax=Ephemerocybe angulata TaxID=980116 RepID=A0A8H5CIY8_9AGAR|nr:hypothetical protein D9611_002020 [Tulosesus angulatus]
MTFSSRFKSIFSSSSSTNTSRSNSPTGIPPYEDSRGRLHQRTRSPTVSSAYANEVASFSDLDWMLSASPTATLTESDTSVANASRRGSSGEPRTKKKRRPVSMFAPRQFARSASAESRDRRAAASPVWESHRNRSANPFAFISYVPGRRAYSMPSMTPFF